MPPWSGRPTDPSRPGPRHAVPGRAVSGHTVPGHAAPRAAPLVTPSAGSRPVARWSGAFARLAGHLDVAWDLDGTLVGHPASPLLHRFILATPRVRHVIVTFRTATGCGDPWAELAAYTNAPGPTCFERVITLQDDRREALVAARRGAHARWSLRRLFRPDPSGERDCRRWKGLVCHQHGLTALVDDLTPMVAEGCRHYGVELFHPDDFSAGG